MRNYRNDVREVGRREEGQGDDSGRQGKTIGAGSSAIK